MLERRAPRFCVRRPGQWFEIFYEESIFAKRVRQRVPWHRRSLYFCCCCIFLYFLGDLTMPKRCAASVRSFCRRNHVEISHHDPVREKTVFFCEPCTRSHGSWYTVICDTFGHPGKGYAVICDTFGHPGKGYDVICDTFGHPGKG